MTSICFWEARNLHYHLAKMPTCLWRNIEPDQRFQRSNTFCHRNYRLENCELFFLDLLLLGAVTFTDARISLFYMFCVFSLWFWLDPIVVGFDPEAESRNWMWRWKNTDEWSYPSARTSRQQPLVMHSCHSFDPRFFLRSFFLLLQRFAGRSLGVASVTISKSPPPFFQTGLERCGGCFVYRRNGHTPIKA